MNVMANRLFILWKANDDSNSIYYSFNDKPLHKRWPIGVPFNGGDSTPNSVGIANFGDNKANVVWKANDNKNRIHISATSWK